MPERLQIVVLFGGRSVEHAVSIRSAHSVLQALPEDRFRATPVAIGEDGRWFTAANPLGVLGDGEEGERRPVLLAPEPGRGLCVGSAGEGETLHPDLVFPLVHGTGGEDGTHLFQIPKCTRITRLVRHCSGSSAEISVVRLESAVE